MKRYLRYKKWYKVIKESELFDVKYYIFTYPDVREQGVDPVWHYLKYGADEGRNPSAEFDTNFYIDKYEDVKESGLNPFVHYILYGIEENRLKSDTEVIIDLPVPRYKYIKENNNINNKTICLFAHYDIDGLIDDYVINYIKQLKDINLDIIFITVCENIIDIELDKIKKYVSVVIVRENVGYDFASWKTGYTYLIEKNIKYKTLIFANDSVYGPIYDFKSIFDSMQNKKFDMWGFTDSLYSNYHLQSYFLVFNEKIIRSNIFVDFIKSIKVIDNKHRLIESYEIGISKILSSDFNLGSYISVDAVSQKLLNKNNFNFIIQQSIQSKTINVTHVAWDILIEDFNFPFIKVELLRDNPMKLKNINKLETIAENNEMFDFNLIKEHIKRTKKITNKVSGFNANKVSGFNIVNKSVTKDNKKTICVMGSARGGTSMIAGLLRIMGVDMGRNIDLDNNEDQDFLDASDPVADIFNSNSENHKRVKAKLISLINDKNNAHDVWGWKDPQSMVYFDKIDSSLINPYCIIIFRDPLAIAQKELNDGIHKDIINTLDLVISHRLNQLLKITKFAKQKKYPLLVISYERSLRDKKHLINTLAEFMNLTLSEKIFSDCMDYIEPDRNSGRI